MSLEGKNAVIYGAAGAVGAAVARAFARDGARVFLTGRDIGALDALAKEISGAGGVAETARVDALDEDTVESHLDSVVQKAGTIDVSFNAIGILSSMTHRKRATTLTEPADVAALVASDQAAAMTGTVANLTGGIIVD
jgi:NAD(P)-dependent dehydrogenase (short-subunit alcohol dehydrogenase family)